MTKEWMPSCDCRQRWFRYIVNNQLLWHPLVVFDAFVKDAEDQARQSVTNGAVRVAPWQRLSRRRRHSWLPGGDAR